MSTLSNIELTRQTSGLIGQAKAFGEAAQRFLSTSPDEASVWNERSMECLARAEAILNEERDELEALDVDVVLS